ncbi:hypothetical protein ES288_A04G032100v1 [Gossypium darwinii]|uniref:B box-type domain-containing protein n=1 Tax=Gossypium darwinii TaxID=34276 RepID=A0A5D2GTQ2_GOSDA|nr:hypothetical protein ES288_A04G032100v1 [Gossypium darwinii]
MRKCELCGRLARMHCESDQANLCWDCDFKVHGANFLVAKHNRTLLCRVCQSPTPWLASGRNLGSAVSVCDSCVVNGNNKCESSEREYGEEEEEEEEEGDYDNDAVEESGEEEEAEIEDAENQVVPWSGESSPLSISKPITSLKSLSSNEREGGGGGGGNGDGGFGLKRMREDLSSWSDDETGCSSSQVSSRGSSNGEASSSMESSRLLKQPKIAEINQSARNQDHDETKSRSTAIISYLKRLEKHTIANDDDASATITGICRLSRDQSR